MLMVALALVAAFAPSAAHAADMNAVNNAAKIAPGVGAGTAVPALGVGAVLQTIVGRGVPAFVESRGADDAQ